MTESENSSASLRSNFGLITARLGLLLTRVASGTPVKEDDKKLLEDGKRYLLHISELAKILKDGGDLQAIIPNLEFLALLIQSNEQVKELDDSQALQQKAEYINELITSSNVQTEKIKDLANVFLSMSKWNIENESAKYFTGDSSNEFRVIF